MNTYQRTCQIERGEGAEPGYISGTLVTDGEASDGHILNIAGGDLPDRAPLLFGHDDYTGTGNLGSWTSFSKYKGSGLGASGIKGIAEIESEGEGSQQAWRDDIAHMIDKQHIGAFSVRWTETEEPTRRVNLPSDHPAFVDEKKASGRQRWGLYFEKWRLLEGSVVTLGADPAALIGRMQAAEGDVRTYWRKAINHALTETHEASGLVGVDVGDGQIIYVERAAWEALLQEANSRYSIAVELHEDANATLRMAHDLFSDRDDFDPELWADAVVEKIRSEGERSTGRDEPEETQPEPKEDAAPLPAPYPKSDEFIADVIQRLREAHTPRASTENQDVMTPRELIEHMGQEFEKARQRVDLKKRAAIEEARGRVVHNG